MSDIDLSDPPPDTVTVRVLPGREVQGDHPTRTRSVAHLKSDGCRVQLPARATFKAGETLTVPTGDADHLQSTGYVEIVGAEENDQ